MFWKFELHPSTAIDSILSKEDCTLIEILEEDDVLQETKSQNRKLINFFIKPEILEELVCLVITEPDEDFDEKLRYKHPNTACEVLTSDVYTIIDKLSSSEDLLNKLWSFLEADPPLNPLLASFFSKVLGVLISRKTSLMLDYLRTKEDFVSLLSKHLGTSAIMDLLLRLITSVESPQLRADLLEWLNDLKLIEALVALIDPEIDEDRNSNAAQALSDIIRLSRDLQSQMQEGAGPDVLLDTIQKRETIGSLLDHMFHGIHSHNDSALVNGIFVLLTLLEVKKGPGEGLMTALDAERLAQGVSATLAALTPRLQDFNDLLTDPPLMNPMQTTIGTLDPPLGNARLQIAKLVASILSTNGDTINKELANLGTVRILWELFFKYPWNNFLHTQVEKCISTILNNPPTEEDGELHTPLVDSLFKDCKCIQKILDAWEDPDPEITHSQARHKGYMGHLTNIANYIVHYREKGRNKDVIESVLNEIPEKDREKWTSFVSGTLAEINKTNTTELVGHHPLQSSSDDDDDPAGYKQVPFLPSETSLQHVFSNYQMQQMTADFMDTFGLDGDEFQEPNDGITSQFDRIGDIGFNISANEDNPNSALFDACCNERIQQFDDSGSDEEDVWEEKELTFSSVVENRKSTLSDSDSDSSDSEEDEQGSPHPQSTGSSGSDDDRIVFTDDTSNSPANSPVKKNQSLENTSNKMDIDSGNAWNNFEPTEVAMDETVSMDASDVGWDRTPENNPPDTGWANFDNFTDIGMAAASAEQIDKRPDSPVAMETETSPSPPENVSSSPSPASAYMIEQDKQEAETKEDQSCDDPSKGLVIDTNNVFLNQASEENVASDTPRNSSPIKTAPLPPRAANYSCEKEDGVPLASNDSDDDISDDDEGLPAEDSRQEISQVENFQLKGEPFNMVMQTPKTTSADNKETVNENSREEPVATHPSPLNTSNSTENPTGNGPVNFHDNPGSQSECSSASSTNKLEDSTSGISSQSETPPLANGPG